MKTALATVGLGIVKVIGVVLIICLITDTKSTAQIIKERKAYFKQKNEFPQEFQESDFNLKEAIIHNTILNRPEY